MYSIYIGPQYILQVEYTFKLYLGEITYILDRDRGNSYQKGESSSENCNKFECKMPNFGLFYVVFSLTKKLSIKRA